jgi:citrate lyase subunit beta/citryl-CoA lyase
VSWELLGPAFLFCPADRPERYLKAAAASDYVILDLEDGVNADDRGLAREALVATPLDPDRTIIRVNPVESSDHHLDMMALADTPYHTVMLAKTESADQVESLAARNVIALCETAKGVREAYLIAEAGPTVGLMWGAEDLIASLGGTSSRGDIGRYRDVARFAREQVLLAAGASGRFAIDAVHLDIGDLEGLEEEAQDAAASGFSGTACIHPTQVAVVRRAYRPTEKEISWARQVVDAAATARGVFAFEGRMVDAPLLRHARTILEFADEGSDQLDRQ